MTETQAVSARILIVDDNRMYREAFCRNLMLHNYDVTEAENTEEALRKISEQSPDVVITDLQMRTETEGLDLIKAVKSNNPLLPVIMISAVGTFEEGALAQRFGASAVLSKSRIEDEIERLYAAIDTSHSELDRNKLHDVTVQRAKTVLTQEGADTSPAFQEIRALLANPDLHPYLRSEAFDLYDQMNERAAQDDARRKVSEALAQVPSSVQPKNLEAVESELRILVPAYDSFTEDSKESLRIAEFLYDQQQNIPGSIDFSRNVGFSYCFAVENEVKARMAKRLQRFLGHEQTFMLIMEMMENNNQSLSVYFHQYLLLLLRGQEMDFTMDNVKQTLRRILEHQSRYKPDGLKALGITVIAFGRTYQWQSRNRTIKVHNPLGLKGFGSDEEIIRFAELLISLQHFRNPYIHPEISDLEKLSIIRTAAFECLNLASKLQ